MSAIFQFDFQKRKQLRFPEINYLNYTKKTKLCTFSLKQRETKTSSGPIPHPLRLPNDMAREEVGREIRQLPVFWSIMAYITGGVRNGSKGKMHVGCECVYANCQG